LLLKKFKYHSKEHYQYSDSSGKNVFFVFRYLLGEKGGRWVTISNGKDSFERKLDEVEEFGEGELWRYMFLDIVPGGYKELVLLNEDYIILGYNFQVLVYEIKDNR